MRCNLNQICKLSNLYPSNYEYFMISFQRFIFYLIILSNWPCKYSFAANLIESGNDRKLKLNDLVFDYQINEPVNLQLQVDLIENFKLNFDLLANIFAFLLDPESPESFFQSVSLLKVSKTFYSAAQFYMSNLLRTLKCPEKAHSSILPAFCLVFGGKKFQDACTGLKNRPIEFKDLLEIGHAIHYKSSSPPIKLALKHLCSLAYHPNSLAFSQYNHFFDNENSQTAWINSAATRVFALNQLPYSAEMYFSSKVFTHASFFDGICRIKDNPETLNKFLNRFLAIPDLTMTVFQLITISAEKGNLLVLEKLLEIATDDVFDSPFNNFLEILINNNLFSTRLLELSSRNKFSLDKSLKTCLNRKNLQAFTQILDHYSFEDLKWLGCKYLLSRKNDDISFYDHRFFIDSFFQAGVDTSIFPLLMPIFDLEEAHFKEIFKKLLQLEEFDFSEPQPMENSLIYHCIRSTENYLELVPTDTSHYFIERGRRIVHVRNEFGLQPSQIKFLLSRSKNPVDLLYFSGKHDEIRIVSELLPMFNLNKTIQIMVHEINLPAFIPNNMSVLRTNEASEWTLCQLAIIFHKISLIELIVSDKRFDRNQLKFKVANRWTALQLTDDFIRFQSEHVNLFPCAHELENVLELLKSKL